jgi:hypothetical protein
MMHLALHRLLPGLILVFVCGCGDGAGSYLAVAREQLAVAEEMVDVLKTVRDAASMKEAHIRLRRLELRGEEIAIRARSLSPPSLEIQEKLEAELSGKRQEVLDETKAQIQRIAELPGGQQFLDTMKLQRDEARPALGLP